MSNNKFGFGANLGPNFNFANDSVFSINTYDTTQAPFIPENFELLNGSNFILLSGKTFKLLS